MDNIKPLSYSQYRIQQALWLQQKDSKRNDMGRDSEQFYLDMYMDYLRTCGIKDGKHFYPVNRYYSRINSYRWPGKNERYWARIEDNIIPLIDRWYKKTIEPLYIK